MNLASQTSRLEIWKTFAQLTLADFLANAESGTQGPTRSSLPQPHEASPSQQSPTPTHKAHTLR